MILYGIGVMYTPGPINILGFNLGVNKKFKESLGYFAGVGSAMLILFLIFGYTGERFIKKEYLIYISAIGTVYILYLAVKLFKASVQLSNKKDMGILRFRDGLIMHLMNPKATLATLPIAIIHYPANSIQGWKILVVSVLLAILASLAPTTYSIIGYILGKKVKQGKTLKVFNITMALLLVYVAFFIFYDHIFLVLTGVNEY